jgi:hypothetical protein
MEDDQLETSSEERLSTPNQNLQSQTSWGYQASSQTPETIDEVQVCETTIGQTDNTG